MRILYLHASNVPPPHDVRADRFVLLSEQLEGEVLQPVWFARPDQLEAEFGAGTWSEYRRGRFRYHWFICYHRKLRRWFASMHFYIGQGLRLHREKPFDCIVVYSHMTPALAGIVLKLLTGARFIPEIATSPHLSYLFEHRPPTFADRLLRLYSDVCLHLSVLISDQVHLLYREQLDNYRLLRRAAASVFHEFVPVSLVPRATDSEREPVVFLVGAPWYLKGADLLIKAFLHISPEFPDVRLRIQGYYPDKAELETLTEGSPKIEIVKAVPNSETLERISRAMVLVLPSRSEGMGRVLIEAMAAGVPTVGSDAGGIPYYISNGETGFVFPSGDARQLADVLRRLLSDADLRRSLGDRGFAIAHSAYNEKVYVNAFASMIRAAVLGTKAT